MTVINQLSTTEPALVDTALNELELVKETIKVQNRLKKDITSDFILAKLSEKDQEMIIESVTMAYVSKTLIQKIKNQEKQHKWNTKTQKWDTTPLNYQQQEHLQILAEKTFDIYMVRPYMISILKRNTKLNHLINGILKIQPESEQTNEEQPQQQQTMLQKLIRKKEDTIQ